MKKIAIDTNVLVRLLITLDTEQSRIAERLLETSHLKILTTVLLETEWILRSVVKADRLHVNTLFRSMLEMPSIEMEEPAVVAAALDLHAQRMDFADALHVCRLGENETFVTFDRDLVRLAKQNIDHVSVELAS